MGIYVSMHQMFNSCPGARTSIKIDICDTSTSWPTTSQCTVEKVSYPRQWNLSHVACFLIILRCHLRFQFLTRWWNFRNQKKKSSSLGVKSPQKLQGPPRTWEWYGSRLSERAPMTLGVPGESPDKGMGQTNLWSFTPRCALNRQSLLSSLPRTS